MRLTAVLLVLASVPCLSATASAMEVTKKVDAKAVFKQGATGPASCAAVVFIQWRDQPGKELRATGFWGPVGGGYGSRSVERPFDDVYYDFHAPSGYHWIYGGESGKAALDGTTPQDCSDLNATHREQWKNADPYVKVTFRQTRACRRAYRNLKRARAEVRAAQIALDRARSDAERASAKRRLRRAKRERASAERTYKKECASPLPPRRG